MEQIFRKIEKLGNVYMRANGEKIVPSFVSPSFMIEDLYHEEISQENIDEKLMRLKMKNSMYKGIDAYLIEDLTANRDGYGQDFPGIKYNLVFCKF